MFYMDRIAKFDKNGPNLNVIIEINPHALFIAEALHYERKKETRRERVITWDSCST